MKNNDLGAGLILLFVAGVFIALYLNWYNQTSTQYGLVQNKWWTSSESCTDHEDADGNFLYRTCTTSYSYYFRTADGDFSVNQSDFNSIIVGHAIGFTQHGTRGWMLPVATDIKDSPPTYLTVHD